MSFSLHISCFIDLVFSILFLSLEFVRLSTKCLEVFLAEFIFTGAICASWISMRIIKSRKILSLISLDILFSSIVYQTRYIDTIDIWYEYSRLFSTFFCFLAIFFLGTFIYFPQQLLIYCSEILCDFYLN